MHLCRAVFIFFNDLHARWMCNEDALCVLHAQCLCNCMSVRPRAVPRVLGYQHWKLYVGGRDNVSLIDDGGVVFYCPGRRYSIGSCRGSEFSGIQVFSGIQ